MSIEKKSLISTLKTTKKANVAKDELDSTVTVSPTTKSPTVRLTARKLNTARKMAIKNNLSRK